LGLNQEINFTDKEWNELPMSSNTVFSQLLQFIYKYQFKKRVDQFKKG